jgi:molybdate/tungstate transport system substrate-binding protein
LAYNANSKFASDLQTKPWTEVVTEAGFKLGSTDPVLDPKGKLATKALKTANLSTSLAQIFPEEQLVGRLQSGQLDAGFFYTSESTELKLPTVSLGAKPPAATYTITILNNAANADNAAKFVNFFLGVKGKSILAARGIVLQAVAVTGTGVPAAVKSVVASS